MFNPSDVFDPANAPDYAEGDLCEACNQRPKRGPHERTCGRDECLKFIYGQGFARFRLETIEFVNGPF